MTSEATESVTFANLFCTCLPQASFRFAAAASTVVWNSMLVACTVTYVLERKKNKQKQKKAFAAAIREPTFSHYYSRDLHTLKRKKKH